MSALKSEDPAETDSELVMRFTRHRDETAFCEIVSRYGAFVMAVCQKVVRNEQDAEDAFQATFLILSQKAGRLKLVSLGGWLQRVAFRACLRTIRKRKRGNEELPSGEYDNPPADEESVLATVQDRETYQLLHEEIHQLPNEYRDTIVLCDLLEYSRSETATRLDKSEASVKAILARARRQLRTRLIKRGVSYSAAIGLAAVATAESKAALTNRQIEFTSRGCCQVHGGAPSKLFSENVHQLNSNGVSIAMISQYTKPMIAVPLALMFAVPAVLLWGNPQNEGDGAPAIVQVQIEDKDVENDSEEATVTIDSPDTTEQLKLQQQTVQLVRKRVVALRRLVESLESGYSEGNYSLDKVLTARRELLLAEIGAAESRKQRVAIRQQHIQTLKQLQARANSWYKSGAADSSDLYRAEAARLLVEIELLNDQPRAMPQREPQFR